MPPLDWMHAKSLSDAAEKGSGADAPAPEPGAQPVPVDAPEDLLDGLNEPQRRAVTHDAGPLLILAGAGSGKTRVITRRIAWLFATRRAAPYEVLAITFTNKAAREMRERVETYFPTRGLWISTFHAMCARILRREIEILGSWTRGFSIYDTYDKNQLLKSITKELGFDVQRFRPGMLGAWISDWKNRAYRGRDDHDSVDDVGIEDEVFLKVRDRYEVAMRENNALDFDDLLLKTCEILEQHPGVRDNYASRFRYVLVDEYQDTNRVQYLLTRMLAGWHGNLAVCGDPDQSIYAWRGADIRNILDFERDFGTAERPVEVVKLEQNYRSTATILRAAQSVIRHNAGRKEKDLWTEKENDVPIQVVECADENDEANEIASRIHGLRQEGVELSDIAIFYRVNFMQRALERGLRMAGVPYQIVGGVEFYQRKEIRDLVSYLQLIRNPHDDVACTRALNVPARGIGEKSVAQVRAFASERGLSMLAAASDEGLRQQIRGRARAGLLAFHQLMETLGGLSEAPAAEVVQRVIDETDYYGWLSSSGDPQVATREENVQELLSHAETYDGEFPEGRLQGFLQDIALVSEVDGYEEGGPKVTLMTLHASKGLEFSAVFLAGLEEELLPHALALADAPDEDGGLEEERRLLYVGMTRAMDRLILTHAGTRLHYGEASWRVPSRFLKEIDPDLLAAGGSPSTKDDDEAVLGAYEAPDDVVELRAGDRVEHDHFGFGRVASLQGAGVNARVTVDFESAGSRILLVQYAKLKVVDR